MFEQTERVQEQQQNIFQVLAEGVRGPRLQPDGGQQNLFCKRQREYFKLGLQGRVFQIPHFQSLTKVTNGPKQAGGGDLPDLATENRGGQDRIQFYQPKFNRNQGPV